MKNALSDSQRFRPLQMKSEKNIPSSKYHINCHKQNYFIRAPKITIKRSCKLKTS